VSGFERVACWNDHIRSVAAWGQVFEPGGAVEQPQIGLTEQISEFRRRNQFASIRHDFLPQLSLLDARVRQIT
jgi:hypothetical protein